MFCFLSLFIFRGRSTREPASSRVTYFILRAYTGTVVSHSQYWKKKSGEVLEKIQVNGPKGRNIARKKSLAVSVACMAIYWPTPRWKKNQFKSEVIFWFTLPDTHHFMFKVELGEKKLNELDPWKDWGQKSRTSSRWSMQSYTMTYSRHHKWNFDSSGLSAEGTLLFASIIPHHGRSSWTPSWRSTSRSWLGWEDLMKCCSPIHTKLHLKWYKKVSYNRIVGQPELLDNTNARSGFTWSNLSWAPYRWEHLKIFLISFH